MKGQRRRATLAFLVLFAAVFVFIGSRGTPESSQQRLNNALILESERDNAVAVSELIGEGADPNAFEQPASLRERVEKDYPKTHLVLRYLSRNNNGPRIYNSALAEAVRLGNANAAKALLAGGANAGQKDSMGFTMLIVATLNGQPNMVKTLLDAGANVEQKDGLGETPLELAKVNDGDKIYLLLKDTDAKQKRTMP